MANSAHLFAFMAVCCFVMIYASPIKGMDGEVLDPIKPSSDLEQSSSKRFDSFTNGFGHSKRGFDEISRSSFGFNKRPFDEIGRTSFGFNKRRNFDEIGRTAFNFNKRRNFDEIGRNAFGFSKRGDFDEIGRSSFGFYRRSPQVARPLSQWRFFSGFGKRDGSSMENSDKRGFDEINRNSFGFNKRK